ncbi:diguanylate cyclase/phosphodiesterase (GGDEF & EAL domains) with PAS/PAC sensor(s) [hydrothermal vent metagenome]|uniref:histidine kinase n=1 Tax=hydrothermal vent metagenome TaxID=652676 RepID=A0A3B1DGK0_9ZZZZ
MNNIKIKNKKKFIPLSVRIITGLCVVMGVAISVSGYYSYQKANAFLTEDAFTSMEEVLKHAQDIFEREINTLKEDVFFLSEAPPVSGILRSSKFKGYDPEENTTEDLWKARLQRIFATILKSRSEYLQVRFIGDAHNGKELVRVDKTSKGIIVVENNQLQNKGNREYFLETKRLAKNEIYISEINLNREMGKIVVPHQPVLRVAVPVYDNNKFFGMIIINVDIDSIFKKVFKNTKFYSFKIVNDQGFYLFHPNSDRTYGFEFDGKNKVQDDYLNMQHLFSATDKENYETAATRIYLPKEILIASKFYFDSGDLSKFLFINLIGKKSIILTNSKELGNAIMGMNIVVMFLMVIVVLVSVRKGLNPLSALSSLAKDIAKGIFPKTVLEVKRNDEIGELTESFNYMIKNLKNSTTSIDVLNKEVDERKKAEENLEKLMKGLQDLQFGIDEHAIVAITDVVGNITYVNNKFCKISQYSREELIGQNQSILNSGFHSKEFIHDFWVVISNGKVWHGEFKNKAKDGSFYWVDTTVIPFKDAHGKIYQYLAIRTDISNIKVTNERIEKAHRVTISIMEDLKKEKNAVILLNKKVEESAKAKSNFLANMSHEIRTPMNSILGFSAMLQKTSLTERQKNFLNTVSMSGELLLGIIDDILDISKLESGKIQLEEIEFSLEDLISEVFKMIVARMKDNPFDTYIDIQEGVPSCIKSDPIRLKQVLVNLLGNAVKFTSSGSIGVIVALDQQFVEDESKCWLRFTVKDTGIGIPEDKKDVIFESFSQADESTTRKFGGTGLGLAISKAIVEALKGKVWIESEEGKGSEFIFNICIKKVNEKIQVVHEEVFRQKKVFIVDDSQIAQKVINQCCQKIGLKVIGVTDSPQAALHKLEKLLKTRNMVPDLILCDIMMEGMTGYDLIRKIKNNEAMKDMKCIAVTADINTETSKESTEELFDMYLNKPINVTDMVLAIKDMFGLKKEEKKEEQEESCAGIKVLVVEDALPNQMLIQAYFEQLGCEGDYANNGQAAIEKLKEGNDYDLCLMDLQMPVMGGIEATEIIRKEITKELPIIALTAAVMKSDQEKAEKIGMIDFLTKPIDMKKLKETILRYGRKINEG